jgi:hypothetical protein
MKPFPELRPAVSVALTRNGNAMLMTRVPLPVLARIASATHRSSPFSLRSSTGTAVSRPPFLFQRAGRARVIQSDPRPQYFPPVLSPQFPPGHPTLMGEKTTKRTENMLTVRGSLFDVARIAQVFAKSAQHAASVTCSVSEILKTNLATKPNQSLTSPP